MTPTPTQRPAQVEPRTVRTSLARHLDRLVVACDGNDIGEGEIGSDENGHENLLGDGTPTLASLVTRIDGNRRGAVEVAVSSSEWLG